MTNLGGKGAVKLEDDIKTYLKKKKRRMEEGFFHGGSKENY